MRNEQRTKAFWAVGTVIIVLYALTPIAWIVSLSLKKGSSITDGRFIPRSITFGNYTSIFKTGQFTLPLRNSIGIALLFRTLDAFRIFDSVFIISNGNNPNVESASVLGYNELLNRLNLGVGSAISVLIFLCVALIAFLFVKGFGTSLSQQRGE